MNKTEKSKLKSDFLETLQAFATTLTEYVSTEDNQWTIKGVDENLVNAKTSKKGGGNGR